MTFRLTPSELALVKLQTVFSAAKFKQESRDERLARVDARRFLKDPHPLTGFGVLDPFQTDHRLAEAMESDE